MISSSLLPQHSAMEWVMPVVPENYERGPLTEGEWWALAQSAAPNFNWLSAKGVATKQLLARLDQPIVDVYALRRHAKEPHDHLLALLLMRRQMHRLGRMFWEWERQDWIDLLCPNSPLFCATYGQRAGQIRTTIIDTAYLLGDVADLRRAGIGQEAATTAKVCFGNDLLTAQCRRVIDLLAGKGYTGGETTFQDVRYVLSMLFLLKRTPYLEDLSEELLDTIAEESDHKRMVIGRVRRALQDLKILSRKATPPSPHNFQASGMAREWHEWAIAWFDQTVDLAPGTKKAFLFHILTTGRWLSAHAPHIRLPEQWTEDLALRFRVDLCSWTQGQYANANAQRRLAGRGLLNKPLGPQAIHQYLTALRRYFTDLSRRSYTVGGAPAGRIRLDFAPKEVLVPPDPIRRALDAVNPRDIDGQVWAKLVMAAATLTQSDLPQRAPYPLSFYRALGLLWVASARRTNELIRLRLDCLRSDWDPEMRDDDGQPIPRLSFPGSGQAASPEHQAARAPNMHYLQIPAGKNRGPYWIWVPEYVADAINAWKRERPRHQEQLLDVKDREPVDYLFCYKNIQVGRSFINQSLIPILCAKAGVETEDARGQITGHRGRSSRLTLLRNKGVSLDDLAEYAGHTDSRTIRRYARQDPILLHRIVRDADDVSRIVEGVVELQAAAQGLPALRWFIGYDTDGEPMYSGNQVYVTCPHRLSCERCGMFIGGTKAKLLHEGHNTLPVTSKVPMTPLETCVIKGDVDGAKECQRALQYVPAPETPDIRLIFNPEGLSNTELEKLAALAEAPAVEKLHQALDAHQKKLTEMQQQHKTGRNALVNAQKKRIKFIQDLIAGCRRRQREQKGG
jgi:integrase